MVTYCIPPQFLSIIQSRLTFIGNVAVARSIPEPGGNDSKLYTTASILINQPPQQMQNLPSAPVIVPVDLYGIPSFPQLRKEPTKKAIAINNFFISGYFEI